jgi:hypothetical protein
VPLCVPQMYVLFIGTYNIFGKTFVSLYISFERFLLHVNEPIKLSNRKAVFINARVWLLLPSIISTQNRKLIRKIAELLKQLESTSWKKVVNILRRPFLF